MDMDPMDTSTSDTSHRSRRLARVVPVLLALLMVGAGFIAVDASPAAAHHQPLTGRYQGFFETHDFGTRASLSAVVSGPSHALTVSLTVGPGAAIECYGRREIPAGTASGTGRSIGHDAYGNSMYEIRFTYPVSGANVTVTARGTLLNNSAWFDGSLNVFVDVGWPLDDCNRTGWFQTDRV